MNADSTPRLVTTSVFADRVDSAVIEYEGTHYLLRYVDSYYPHEDPADDIHLRIPGGQ